MCLFPDFSCNFLAVCPSTSATTRALAKLLMQTSHSGSEPCNVHKPAVVGYLSSPCAVSPWSSLPSFSQTIAQNRRFQVRRGQDCGCSAFKGSSQLLRHTVSFDSLSLETMSSHYNQTSRFSLQFQTTHVFLF